MAVIATKIIKSDNNIVLKSSDDKILKIIPSQLLFANPDPTKDTVIILNTIASSRNLHIENFPIEVSTITEPTPPLLGWTVDLLLQELNSNYINKLGVASDPIYVNVVNQIDLTIIQNLLTDIKTFVENIDENTDTIEYKLDTINTSITNSSTLNHSDLLSVLTELQSIEANTDGLESGLTSIITGLTDNKTFGDNGTVNTVAASITSVLLAASNLIRKDIYLLNNSNKTLWVSFTSPAVIGKGILVSSNSSLSTDSYRGAIYGIWATGATGDCQVTEVAA